MAVTVHEYIEAMFREREDGEEVCLSYPAPEGDFWINRYYNPKKPYEDDAWTVCVSTIKRDGKATRKRTDLLRAHMVLLDDIGTGEGSKIEKEPPVQPTCIIESSRGNHQWQYAIHPHDLTEDKKGVYEACIKALAEKGYTEGGASGSYRMVRIPGSLHRKGGKFKARVQLWKPDRIWDLKELIRQFGITGEEIEKHLTRPKKDLSHLPPPNMKDPVLTWLEQTGQILQKRDGEFFDIECPFRDPTKKEEHSPAGYSPIGFGDEKHKRVFHCFHDHCQRYNGGTYFIDWVKKNGGPDVGLYFTLNHEWLSSLSIKEKNEVLYNELPRLTAYDLPRIKANKQGQAMDRQWHVFPNVKEVADRMGVRIRWNMMARDVTATFDDPNRQALCVLPEMPLRAVVDGCTMAGLSNEKQVRDIVTEVALQNPYHPMEDWIRSREWDGISRFESILSSVTTEGGLEDIWMTYLSRWMCQVVQAVCGWRNPKQVGHVLVFVGKEGIQKTRWFEHLVPREFYNESIHLAFKGDHKDSVMRATTTPIGELGEIETTFSKSETGMIKAFLTDSLDTIRPPYGPVMLKIPRCTVFCGTVNRTTFLRDTAGTRRYWPINVLYCNVDHGEDLQQVWAEIYSWWKGGMKWWLDEHEKIDHADQVDKYAEPSEIEDIFADYWDGGQQIPEDYWLPMNISDIARALEIINRGGNYAHLQELIVQKVGGRKTIRHGGTVKQRAWLLPDPVRVEERKDRPSRSIFDEK